MIISGEYCPEYNRTVVELIYVLATCALVIFRVKAQVVKKRLSKG